MKNRTLINNGKGSIIKCPVDYNPASFDDFLADLKSGMFVDINPNNSSGADAGVTEVGTPLNKEHLLTDEVAQSFGFISADDPSINDILEKIGSLNESNEVTINVLDWTASGSLFVAEIIVEGVTTSVEPNIKGIIYPNNCDDTTRRAIQRSASYITNIETLNGAMRFTATIKPTVAITFGVGV